ncbi:universal stress protein [Flagellimonas aquimarina]|uniref:Universal stress protein n=1 Tax=Flagellimonas aquimarina TaxID=2201895 RepID=A0A316KY35_9FLAO|nr:universal stress protein [Allomuricauda koreensis]PWL37649.1 universal stress protein [Allomuricauda koreensis]
MKNILIPIDFSEYSENALRYAQGLFQSINCNFYLLHVNTLLNSEKKTILGKNLNGSKNVLAQLMDKTKQQSANDNHHFYALNEHGFFIESVKKQIEDKSIDLIAMGTKGVSGLRQKVVGSNAGDVITKVQCNTLVIPKEIVFSKPSELAFPTDFNIFYSHSILSSITEILHLSDGQIRIMNVSKQDQTLNSDQEQNKAYLIDFFEESFQKRFSFHTITNKNVKSAIQCFVESRDIDMIVMVAKNLNFIQQVLFDSIVEKISFHTKNPFYVIHE